LKSAKYRQIWKSSQKVGWNRIWLNGQYQGRNLIKIFLTAKSSVCGNYQYLLTTCNNDGMLNQLLTDEEVFTLGQKHTHTVGIAHLFRAPAS